MIYCVSDIHGEVDRFRDMLALIRFSERDTLYIIGDVIDRHPGGVEILKMIMDAPNMVMVLGNHEKMCLDTLGPDCVYGARALWRQNGGNRTYRELLYICSANERNRILRFIASLSDHMDVEVNGQAFHLVHGMPSDNPEERIWNRPAPGCVRPFSDKIAIIGHTPTCFITNDFNSTYRIWHGDGIIDIDCGCGNETEFRRLACLRLDDMKEFYI